MPTMNGGMDPPPIPSRITNDCRLVIRTSFQLISPIGIPTHYPRNINHTPSIIDLVLARCKAASYSQTCSIKTSSPSDHMILELRLSLPQALQPTRRPRHLWAKTNWNIYDRTMDDLLSNISPPPFRTNK
jgi:hypothetical protein